MNVINKLTQWASLIGVIGAIGGGFYAWGEFNTRLSAIENKDFVVNETVDLTGVNDKIADIRVEVIDRIKIIEDKMSSESDQGINELWADVEELWAEMAEAQKDIAIVQKENELQDSKIEQIRIKATNPLAN
tara:strand:+ start:671 stop:1066 length:396 start_codon:yes stop_codon:yes gene_type:complete